MFLENSRVSLCFSEKRNMSVLEIIASRRKKMKIIIDKAKSCKNCPTQSIKSSSWNVWKNAFETTNYCAIQSLINSKSDLFLTEFEIHKLADISENISLT